MQNFSQEQISIRQSILPEQVNKGEFNSEGEGDKNIYFHVILTMGGCALEIHEELDLENYVP